MAENRSEEDQRLSSLPTESVKRICSCLSFEDLLRACTTFPGWEYVLSLPYYQPLIANRIQWLDGYLCQLISTDSGQVQFTDSCQAMLYYSAAGSKSSVSSQPKAKTRIVDSRFFPNTLQTPFTWLELVPNRSLTYIIQFVLRKSCYKGKDYFVVDESSTEDANAVLCIVYGSGSLNSRIEEGLKNLKSHRILLVVRFKLCDEMNKSNLQCMSECYQHLKDYLSRANSPKWRIWCIDIRHFHYGHLEIIFEWACNQMSANTV